MSFLRRIKNFIFKKHTQYPELKEEPYHGLFDTPINRLAFYFADRDAINRDPPEGFQQEFYRIVIKMAVTGQGDFLEDFTKR